ncbi:mandelate racemase/muconate lactonizing enzyme family protein [Ottowia thiooxydans]|uniref:mandelate racemase/muconate lactonizing enzyme family protein n=1 Tax=Ottowia thiooxydans TaxID=219182 RepID=UPI00040DBCCF|nr:o-succinylbenzoate synthase [Ottowia thiooxydans]
MAAKNVIEVKPYRLALQTPYRWSKGTQHHRMGAILRLESPQGLIGWGEAALPPHVDYPPEAFVDEIRALMAGLDPLSPQFLEEISLRECPSRIRCGISTAVLTLRAAQAGQTLAGYLLGDERRVPARVPVNDLIGDAEPEMCAQRANDAAARGQDTVKVKCTSERELDLRRIQAIREAEPTIKIRLDPNESWPVEWAGEQLRAMEKFTIEYCEEPLPRGTPLSVYGQLRRETKVPIALDDSIRTVRDVELAAIHKAADVFIIKAQRVGGPDKLLEIVQAATQYGIECTVTSSLETSLGLYLGIHCTALTPEPMAAAGIGTARFYAENVCEPPPIVNGYMAVPNTPGLGFDPQPWWDLAR